MADRRKLFFTNDTYNHAKTDTLFVLAMKENVSFHTKHCPQYKRILSDFNFDISSVNTVEDLYKIPPLPASYLKNHTMLSKPYNKLIVKTTSSGTGGKKTLSGFDTGSGLCAMSMLLKIFKYNKLLSLRRTNYIILGYKPDKSNQTAMAKALKWVSVLAPPVKIEYALKIKNGEYNIDVDGIMDAIVKFSKQNKPVRIIGFPAYFKMFLEELNERNIKIHLHKNSKILLGGGWKSMFAEAISKDELFEMANAALGIQRRNFKDQFSTAEHPTPYIACENHRFHIPAFSRVIVRDIDSLSPVGEGVPGILNLISPLLTSMPYGSILTDDIVIKKNDCGCGNPAPYFEIMGRVGLANVKTCTQAASDFLKKI
ncbi:MAG: acyl-protein synthetase [Oscillospiraceae bacterium]|nr:acyl-protein synthetase [Oscillospiraceae bacterium]